jgi:hypothetical protein
MVGSLQEMLSWANKQNKSDFTGAVITIGALVGGLWLASKLFGSDDDDGDDEDEYEDEDDLEGEGQPRRGRR